MTLHEATYGIPDPLEGNPKRCGQCRKPIGQRHWTCYPCYNKGRGKEVNFTSVCSYCAEQRALHHGYYCDECYPQFAYLFEPATPEQIDAALTELQEWVS